MSSINIVKSALRPSARLSRTLGSTTQSRGMSAFSSMSDNDPHTIAVEKEKHLKEEASVRWNEKLASHSEAAVKADQSQEKPIKILQEESSHELKQKTIKNE
ncbi:hypothetical protein BCR43DRAFT_470681 [Syncephalastrum racemosum]|uniref:Uncharacterized protein n=1 Tax=Syncephalastrum racemosum TaxID=13706 RepID=A0A1X2HHG0_SYNRA|nr:hypothetical protein BCR43DRAFT_470681 [Syncephalastrum racemosum]